MTKTLTQTRCNVFETSFALNHVNKNLVHGLKVFSIISCCCLDSVDRFDEKHARVLGVFCKTRQAFCSVAPKEFNPSSNCDAAFRSSDT